MNITVEKLPDCKASLHVELPAEDVEKERNRLIKAFASQARIPGFRPGKTPRRVVEKRFASQIREELQERLIQQATQDAIEKENLDVIGIGKIEDTNFHDDGAFGFTAEVVTSPEIELPEYKGIAIEVPRIEVGEENIENVLQNLRDRFSQFEDLTDRELANGDFAVISYEGSYGGEPLDQAAGMELGQLSANEEYWLKLEDGDAFLPGFASQLLGKRPGDEVEVKVTLPDDFSVEKLQGKEISYATKIKEAKVQQLPDLDDELAAKIEPGKTLEELREMVRENLIAEQERAQEDLKTNLIIEHINEKLEFELPEHVVSGETQRQIDDIVRQNQQRGIDDDTLMQNQDQIVANAQGRARDSVKTTFILQEIAKAEKIEPSQQELQQRIAIYAAQTGRPVKKVLKELQEEDGISNLRHQILISKTLEFLKENAEVTEVDPPKGDETST